MKDSFYFPHDYHARHDPKLERLRMEIGAVGDGIYWDIVEMLYEEGGYLPLIDIPLIAKSLNTPEELVNKVIKESKLFCVNGTKFYSESLLLRLKHINVKRRKARTSAKLSHSAFAQRSHSVRSAIKERKESKESKVKKVNNNVFPFEEIFLKYPNKDGKKQAELYFKSSIKTEKDFEDIKTALNNYLKSEKVSKGFIKNASTWFNNWRDWIIPPMKDNEIPESLRKYIKE